MRSWRVLAPLILVVLGVAVLAPLLLLRSSGGADQAEGRARDAATSARVSSSPTPKRESGGATPAAEPYAAGIEIASSTYFGRPFETVEITGRYRGVQGPTRLRVEVRQPEGWSPFPLPAVTGPTGHFKAYVEVGGPAVYRLRIVDTLRDVRSPVFGLVVF